MMLWPSAWRARTGRLVVAVAFVVAHAAGVEFSTRAVSVGEKAGSAHVTLGVFFGPGDSAPFGGTVTVGLRVTGGTATPGTDFTPPAGSVSFSLPAAPGPFQNVTLVVQTTISIPIVDDGVPEGNETIILALASADISSCGDVSCPSIIIGNLNPTITIQDVDTTQIAASGTEGLKSLTALGNLAVTTTTVQTTNVGLRLASLRRGERGFSVSGLALNMDGQSVALNTLASLFSDAEVGRAGQFGVFGP